MKVTMFWYGGSSYAMFDVHDPKDAETFSSLKAAKDSFAARAGGSDSYFPCVENSEAWIFYGANVIGQEYPDLLLSLGPRGGVRVERA
jgi:hypothetical protein